MKRGIIALFALMMFSSCANNTTAKSSDNNANSQIEATTTGTVEVLYMHGKQRCPTCIAIGEETEALIKELGEQRVIMKTIDISTTEGEKIADKYEIVSSSLIVINGTTCDYRSMGIGL